MFTMGLQGLGLTVTQTTKFDPIRMKSRFTYWLETVVNQMAEQARTMIRSSGMRPDEAEGVRANYRNRAIAAIPFKEMSGKIRMVEAGWSQGVPVQKGQGMAAQMAMMYISFVNPFIGIGMMVAKMFGKKKKMQMPWNTIYAQALPHAQELTVVEETNRIAEEILGIKVQVTKAVEQRSARAAQFKLPEGVIGITKGALVMGLKGKPVETRAEVKR